jgi:hypothetical protein
MDKTYLISSPWHKYTRHIAMKGSHKPRKQTPEKGSGTHFVEVVSLLLFLFLIFIIIFVTIYIIYFYIAIFSLSSFII